MIEKNIILAIEKYFSEKDGEMLQSTMDTSPRIN